MKNSDTQVQVNIMSQGSSDDMESHDVNLPQNLDMLADIDSLLNDKTVQNSLQKITSKYVKKPEKKKQSLREGNYSTEFILPNKLKFIVFLRSIFHLFRLN